MKFILIQHIDLGLIDRLWVGILGSWKIKENNWRNFNWWIYSESNRKWLLTSFSLLLYLVMTLFVSYGANQRRLRSWPIRNLASLWNSVFDISHNLFTKGSLKSEKFLSCINRIIIIPPFTKLKCYVITVLYC